MLLVRKEEAQKLVTNIFQNLISRVSIRRHLRGCANSTFTDGELLQVTTESQQQIDEEAARSEEKKLYRDLDFCLMYSLWAPHLKIGKKSCSGYFPIKNFMKKDDIKTL